MFAFTGSHRALLLVKAVAALLGSALVLVAGPTTSADAAASSSTHAIPYAGPLNVTTNGLTTLCASGGYDCTTGGYDGSAAQIDSGGLGWASWQYWSSGTGGTKRHNCTTYAAFRLQRAGLPYPGQWGNATTWDTNAPATMVDQRPGVGAIAQWNSGWGHVGHVDVVTASYIEVTADNWGGGTTRHRIYNGSPYWPDNFIHALNPFGNIDSVSSPAPGHITVRGWTLDPSQRGGSIPIHVYVNGSFAGSATANTYRPDVPAAYNHYGANVGFNTTFGLAQSGGSKNVCVYAINVGAGDTNPLLGCRTVWTADPNPFGHLDQVSAAGFGRVRIRGWAADPNARSGPIQVHIYNGSSYLGSLTTGAYRPDVANAYPGYGTNLGYDATIWVGFGKKVICAYPINVGPGNVNPQTGCTNVSVW